MVINKQEILVPLSFLHLHSPTRFTRSFTRSCTCRFFIYLSDICFDSSTPYPESYFPYSSSISIVYLLPILTFPDPLVAYLLCTALTAPIRPSIVPHFMNTMDGEPKISPCKFTLLEVLKTTCIRPQKGVPLHTPFPNFYNMA